MGGEFNYPRAGYRETRTKMREIISTREAPAAVGPYSQAVKAGAFVFSAGQLGIDPATGKFAQGGIEAQTRQALTNLQAILEAAGTSVANVVKVTVFLHRMDDFAAMNGVYRTFFTEAPPARSAVAVKDLLPGGLVEIEAVALVEG
jgi:2-iminobutanoate/2-iminopropanoate deaminase